MKEQTSQHIDININADEFFAKHGRKKILATLTLGCKVNQYETNAMEELFRQAGYEVGHFDEFADVYVINTCTVTNMSDKKSRQLIRKSKRINPDAIIAVAGCYSQTSPEEILDIEEVDIVMGTNDRNKIVEVVESHMDSKICTVDDIMKVKEFEEMTLSNMNERTRAFLKIQEGCQQFCSYCIIPYARGPIRSRKLENIVSEVESLVQNGYKEFVLTGIHVASYGKDLGDVDLMDAIKAIHAIEGVERIRMSSIEPLIMTDGFIEELSRLPKICPHFHLSLQSGCDTVLKRMNRKYTTAQYGEIVDKLRTHIKDASITTDVIVGFPGETDDEFEQTYKFLKEVELSQMHVFKYSQRTGTPAAKMKDQVTPQLKQIRSDRLISLNAKNNESFMAKYIDAQMEVLFEKNVKDDIYEGLTGNYIRVYAPSAENIEGQIRTVKISSICKEHLEGRLI